MEQKLNHRSEEFTKIICFSDFMYFIFIKCYPIICEITIYNCMFGTEEKTRMIFCELCFAGVRLEICQVIFYRFPEMEK